MKKAALFLILFCAIAPYTAPFARGNEIDKDGTRGLLADSGVRGGLVVHIGCGDGKLTAGLCAGDSFLVHGLDTDSADVEKARRYIQSKGLYGKVSVGTFDGKHLPYADNLVNLVVAMGECQVPSDEISRVLAPNGIAARIDPDTRNLEPESVFRKPWPGEIDEWTHYLHGPDNNAVAQDTRVGLPRHVQWIGGPKFARSHEQLASVSAMVSSRGRIFYVVDEGQTADIRMPPQWRLVARDAFNGVVLWKRRIDRWADHLHGFRSGPPDLPFRLVADGDRVYATLGLDEPVTALDGATGKTLMTYEGTKRTRQIVHVGDRLIMLLGTSQVAIHTKRRGNDSPAKRVVLAADRQTGNTLWRKDISTQALLPLVVSGDQLLYQTDEHLVCLEVRSGDEAWRIDHPCSLARPGHHTWQWASPTLVAHEGIVYVADFRKLSALSLADGKAMWESSATAGFCSPPDIFVINGLVWRGYTPSRGSADFGEGLDARTGEKRTTINTKKAWDYATLAHHRCYRPKATSRFIMASRSGIEFIDLTSGKISPNHWTRGTCQYGVMPANGLLYAPPHSCACNIKTMLRGLHAYAASSGRVTAETADARLDTGPAFGKLESEAAPDDVSEDWPTLRCDNERSGRAATRIPNEIRHVWGTKIGGRLSSPVVSGGKLFVAAIDRHTIHALDATHGKPLWSFIAGGRVDSPPTIHKSAVFFGSADGWVYCLRESDGALVWRFRAAPRDRLIVARGQLESAWPLHGSVLVDKGTLIVAAGRSSYVDGGIYLYRLDPVSGRPLSETVIHSLDAKGDQPDGGVDLRGVLNDVLAVSGGAVYMRHLKIDFKTGDDLATGPPHLFAPMGFLDDMWWHRSYWLFGSDAVCMPPVNESGWQIWPRVGNMVPAGRILALGKDTVYGYGRDKYPGGMAGQIRGGETYRLFAAARKARDPLPSYRDEQHLRGARSGRALGLKVTQRDRQHGAPSLHGYHWSRPMPVFVRALALANDTLFLAGPPEPAELRKPALQIEVPEKGEAAFLGKQGAVVWLVSAADGKKLAEYKLESPPVFDGMIAAESRLYLSCIDGRVVCMAGKE